MRIIMDQRARGRTEALLDAASKLQESNPGFVVILIAPYMQRADYLSRRVMERIQIWLDGEEDRGLDPARTLVEHAQYIGMRLRGRSLVMSNTMHVPGQPSPAHKVFAFIDDADELGQGVWDNLMDDLTASGVAVAAAVFTSQR